jgi:hypothetical protein
MTVAGNHPGCTSCRVQMNGWLQILNPCKGNVGVFYIGDKLHRSAGRLATQAVNENASLHCTDQLSCISRAESP